MQKIRIMNHNDGNKNNCPFSVVVARGCGSEGWGKESAEARVTSVLGFLSEVVLRALALTSTLSLSLSDPQGSQGLSDLRRQTM